MDLHLDLKVGPHRTMWRKPKRVETPGNYEKQYVADAMGARTNRVVWTQSIKKDSDLFVAFLPKLNRAHSNYRRLLVIRVN